MAEFPAWGIHVTTASVRGVKIEEIDGELRIVAHDQADFADDIDDVNSLEKHGALAHALAVFMKRHDMSRCRVFVSVDAVSAFNRFVRAPMVQDENLMRILAYEAQQQIPFDLEGVFWDHKVLDVRQDDGEVDVLLFAIKKEVVDERIRRLSKLRFPVDGLQLGPLALYNFAVNERLVKDGQILVSVDFDRIELLLCHEKKLWFRTLPMGFHPMFGEISKAYDVRHRQAVKIVRGEFDLEDKEALKKIIRSNSERLSREVSRMISYFDGALEKVTLSSVVLIPGSVLVPPMTQTLKKLTGLEIHTLKSFRRIPVAMPEISPNIAGLAHATGLALQALGKSDVDIKLFPLTMERVIAGRRVFYVLSILLLFVMIAGMWLVVDSGRNEIIDAQDQLALKTIERDQLSTEFNQVRKERQLKDEIMPYRQAGDHRLVPAQATTAVLRAVEAANLDLGAAERIHVALLKTKVAPDDGKAIGSTAMKASRRIELTVGLVEGETPQAARRSVESGLFKHLARDRRLSGFKIDQEFIAANLVARPPADVDDLELRRRFIILKTSFVFEAAGQKEPAK